MSKRNLIFTVLGVFCLITVTAQSAIVSLGDGTGGVEFVNIDQSSGMVKSIGNVLMTSSVGQTPPPQIPDDECPSDKFTTSNCLLPRVLDGLTSVAGCYDSCECPENYSKICSGVGGIGDECGGKYISCDCSSAPTTCPSGQQLSTDANGCSTCIACPSAPTTCPSGQKLGTDANGCSTCVSCPSASTTCPNGQQLSTDENGCPACVSCPTAPTSCNIGEKLDEDDNGCPACVSCGALPAGGGLWGDNCTLTCDPGYDMLGGTCVEKQCEYQYTSSNCTTPKVLGGGSCVKNNVTYRETCTCPQAPTNATITNAATCAWSCNSGFEQSGNSCVEAQICPVGYTLCSTPTLGSNAISEYVAGLEGRSCCKFTQCQPADFVASRNNKRYCFPEVAIACKYIADDPTVYSCDDSDIEGVFYRGDILNSYEYTDELIPQTTGQCSSWSIAMNSSGNPYFDIDSYNQFIQDSPQRVFEHLIELNSTSAYTFYWILDNGCGMTIRDYGAADHQIEGPQQATLIYRVGSM